MMITTLITCYNLQISLSFFLQHQKSQMHISNHSFPPNTRVTEENKDSDGHNLNQLLTMFIQNILNCTFKLGNIYNY